VLRVARDKPAGDLPHVRAVADVEALARFTAGGVAERLGEVAADLSLQVYRPLSVGEAMPWAARTAFRDRG
jgi:hypothetical protein